MLKGCPLMATRSRGWKRGTCLLQSTSWVYQLSPAVAGVRGGALRLIQLYPGYRRYLDFLAPRYPEHDLVHSVTPAKEKAFALRSRAQKGDPLALEIFDYQAKALGLHVANLTIAFDAEFVVIGGGLIDPGATTEEFRERYLCNIRLTAEPWLFPVQRQSVKIVPAALGELSQAIGAALVALYTAQGAHRK